jgi:hypothetical protein
MRGASQTALSIQTLPAYGTEQMSLFQTLPVEIEQLIRSTYFNMYVLPELKEYMPRKWDELWNIGPVEKMTAIYSLHRTQNQLKMFTIFPVGKWVWIYRHSPEDAKWRPSWLYN